MEECSRADESLSTICQSFVMYRTFDKGVLPPCVEHCAGLMTRGHRGSRTAVRSGPCESTQRKESPMYKRVLELVSKPCPPLETHREEQTINKSAVLQELYILLEDYAPVWYSSKIRIRLQTALRATEEPAAPATQALRLVCRDR